MTDKEKWQEIVAKVESMKDINPITYQLWQAVMAEVKPKIEQALEAQDTKVPNGGN